MLHCVGILLFLIVVYSEGEILFISFISVQKLFTPGNKLV